MEKSQTNPAVDYIEFSEKKKLLIRHARVENPSWRNKRVSENFYSAVEYR